LNLELFKTRLVRRVIAGSIIALVAMAPVTAGAQQTQAQQPTALPALTPPPPGYVFPAHETLAYNVDWRVFAAGTAVFHLETQGTQEKVTASADTLGAVNMLFPVEDRFQSTFDTRTGCSSTFSKQIQEGRRKINADLAFNYDTGKQLQTEKNVVKGTVRHTEAPIPSCVTDSLSALFFAASQRFVVGQSVTFPLGDTLRTIPVTMKVVGHEEIKTPAGTFQTIRVQPTTDPNAVKNRGNLQIWYSDDPRHIPVQMRAFLFWGTITFHLQSIENK
jgi:hypothetical protein